MFYIKLFNSILALFYPIIHFTHKSESQKLSYDELNQNAFIRFSISLAIYSLIYVYEVYTLKSRIAGFRIFKLCSQIYKYILWILFLYLVFRCWSYMTSYVNIVIFIACMTLLIVLGLTMKTYFR